MDLGQSPYLNQQREIKNELQRRNKNSPEQPALKKLEKGKGSTPSEFQTLYPKQQQQQQYVSDNCTLPKDS